MSLHKAMKTLPGSTFNYGAQVECVILFPPYPSEEVSIRQKWDKAIAKEVCKLQDVEFIRKVYYPNWLANVVMIKKANGKWRMCVDFTNLSKAFPKDSYPLPRVDVLVDLTARHQLLSFMDAFFSYNHIKLDKTD